MDVQLLLLYQIFTVRSKNIPLLFCMRARAYWLFTKILLEKWFPLQGERAHSLYCWSFQKQNREVGGQDNNNRPIKVITFSTD